MDTHYVSKIPRQYFSGLSVHATPLQVLTKSGYFPTGFFNPVILTQNFVQSLKPPIPKLALILLLNPNPELQVREFPDPELHVREIPNPELQIREIPDPELHLREISEPELHKREIPDPDFRIREIPDPELEIREIQNPSFNFREILNPEKPTGDPQLVRQHCYHLIIHWNRKFFFIADTSPKSKLRRRGNRRESEQGWTPYPTRVVLTTRCKSRH